MIIDKKLLQELDTMKINHKKNIKRKKECLIKKGDCIPYSHIEFNNNKITEKITNLVVKKVKKFKNGFYLVRFYNYTDILFSEKDITNILKKQVNCPVF